MPKGESPYLTLAQTICRGVAARGVFLYVMEGQYGDSWCVWAPPEVAARMPEMLNDAADDIWAGEVGSDNASKVSIVKPLHAGEEYHDLCEHACRITQGAVAFLYVVEGRDGSGWAIFAPPKYTPLQLAELIRGFADDLKREEPKLRHEAELH